MIRHLPEGVRAKLRSGVAIASLGQCIEELALNSIDAEANCVAVRVNVETFRVQVVDNGSGMGKEDVRRAGDRYFTSKCGSVEDLENPKFYGFRGEALASIAALANAVEVSSKAGGTAKTFLKLIHAGKALDVCEADSVRPSAGTTVTAYNLFYQLPVRRKGMDSRLEFERIRRRIEALSLMHPSVSFSLKNEASGATVLQLPKAKDVRARFCQIYGLGRAQKLKELNCQGGGFECRGYVGAEAHYNRNMQFLFVNGRLVLRTRLHKLIDFLLRKESVICKPKGGPAGRPPSSSHPRPRSASERHGVYVVNVRCHVGEYDVCMEPAKTLIEFRDWDALLACVEEGVRALLKRERLFVESSGEDSRGGGEGNGLGFAAALRPAASGRGGGRESFRKACDDLLDSYEPSATKSKAVKRRAAGESGTLENSGRAGDRAGPVADSALRAAGEPAGGGGAAGVPLPDGRGPACDLPRSVAAEREVAESESEGTDSEAAPREPAAPQSGGAAPGLQGGGKDPGPQKDRAGAGGPAARVPGRGLPRGHAERAEGDPETDRKARPFGRPPVAMCDGPGRRGGADQELSGSRGRADSPAGQVKLATAGFLTHLVQNPPPGGSSDVNPPSRRCLGPGPLSAREVFERRTDTARQAPDGNRRASNSNGRPTALPARKHDGADAGDRPGGETQVPSVNERLFSHAGRPREGAWAAPAPSAPFLLGSSSSLLPGRRPARRRKQPEKRPPVYPGLPQKKLRSCPQLGSLEKFKRRYGKVESRPTAGPPEAKSGPAVPTPCHSPDELEIPRRKSGGLRDSGIRETSTARATEPSDVGPVLSPENPPPSGKEGRSDRRPSGAGETPSRPTAASRAGRRRLSDDGPPGSLASKLSRMRGRREEDPSSETTHLSGRPPTESRKTGPEPGRTSIGSPFRPSPGGTREAERTGVVLDWDAEGQDERRGEGGGGGSLTAGGTTSAAGRPPSGRPPRDRVANPPPPDGGADSIEDVRGDSGLLAAPPEPRSLASDVLGAPRDDLDPTRGRDEEAGTRGGSEDEEEPSPRSSDWLQHFDVSLGRTVHVNKITGLSTFRTPPEETPVDCTKDLTTVAVNVVSGNGFQCKCHPFRSDLVLPFLPSAQKARTVMKQDHQDGVAGTPAADSLRSLFSEWDNPVFARYPEVAVDVSSGRAEALVVKIHNVLYPYRFTKEMVHSMQVLRQVDNKFIACLMNTKLEENEKADSYEKWPLKDAGRRKLLSSALIPPLEIVVTEEEKRLLRCCCESLEDLGLELTFPDDSGSRVLVEKVPLCFTVREASNLRRGREPGTQSIVKELIREQAELLRTTGRAQATLPLTVKEVLASQACHGAIRFNDSLSLEESRRLIETLSRCHLPFQCAHGRPSMLPLADLDHMEEEKQPKPNMAKLRRMARAWHLFGKPAVRSQSQSPQPAASPQEPP
uniref:MutL homolog 3 n=1 Tax=Ornithorhynchus anatinus TaxID=9258 RepID=A0A6I8NHH9_ORNAN